jgi:hypothetical protein
MNKATELTIPNLTTPKEQTHPLSLSYHSNQNDGESELIKWEYYLDQDPIIPQFRKLFLDTLKSTITNKQELKKECTEKRSADTPKEASESQLIKSTGVYTARTTPPCVKGNIPIIPIILDLGLVKPRKNVLRGIQLLPTMANDVIYLQICQVFKNADVNVTATDRINFSRELAVALTQNFREFIEKHGCKIDAKEISALAVKFGKIAYLAILGIDLSKKEPLKQIVFDEIMESGILDKYIPLSSLVLDALPSATALPITSSGTSSVDTSVIANGRSAYELSTSSGTTSPSIGSSPTNGMTYAFNASQANGSTHYFDFSNPAPSGLKVASAALNESAKSAASGNSAAWEDKPPSNIKKASICC